MGADKGDEMEEKLKLGDRIKRLRGGLTQAAFADLVGAGQTSVSEWELGNAEPSAAISFRLAALSHNPEDSMTFLKQAGLEPDAVVSVADMLLKKGEVKMDAILATAENKLKDRMGDQKQMEDEGKVILVPPFPEDAPLAQQPLLMIPVPAFLVSHKASTYYVTEPSSIFSGGGHGVAPGDVIVFDASEVQPGDFDRFIGEELVVRITPGEHGPGGLFLGRAGIIAEGPKLRHLVLAPMDEPPSNWALHRLHQGERSFVKLGDSHGTPIIGPHGAHQRSDWHPLSACRILGRLIARFSTGPVEFWKRQARGPA
jgi:transcriptional regulator with XRE-family HTH domain